MMTEENKSKKYVTLTEGNDFRQIAKYMTDAGYQMNHATARNVLMASMKKVISSIGGSLGTNLTTDQIVELLSEQQIHHAFGDVLHEVYHQNIKENS
jgi:lactate dehydrogenase-like 2-hydroxyacid dehydrogenase